MDVSKLKYIGILLISFACTCVHANSVDVFKRSNPEEKSSIIESAIEENVIENNVVLPKVVEKKVILQGKGLFDHESHSLGASSEQALFGLVSNLEELENIQYINVLGHTDSSGRKNTNLRISAMRANSVQAFLKGAYPEIPVTAEGMGETSPAYTNSTPEGREQNRRVEILIFIEEISE